MFFSPELLSKRDSGFGLLWLAATLGPKSSFKKLPRRSIQTADISQLCDLISHPSEPLALRLSSNLMVGVARVYKIKHEIFVSDVTNCFAHLKKAVHDMHALGAVSEAQLQMGQPSARPDTLTLTADPTLAVSFELDAFDVNWADISGFGPQRKKGAEEEGDNDDEFTLGKKPKSKGKGKTKQSMVLSETGRANLHTLDEYHEHLLSNSFDVNGSFLAGFDPSSSQIDPAMNFGSFGFDDNLFGAPGDQLDLGLDDIGDDLARELGEGWGADFPSLAVDAPMDVDQQPEFQMGGDFDIGFDPGFDDLNGPPLSEGEIGKTSKGKKRSLAGADKENLPIAFKEGLALTPRSILTQHSQNSAPRSFAEELVANDNEIALLELAGGKGTIGAKVIRKPKKVRILLDARTELTDEELKAAREKYVEDQSAIRLEMERKQIEKEGGRVFEDLIWGVPNGLTAPALTSFWSEIYKIQVESRSGNVHLDGQGEPPTKRRKKTTHTDGQNEPEEDINAFVDNDYPPMEAGAEYDFGVIDDAPVYFDDFTRIRSSEEPERGRDARPRASPQLGFDPEALNPSSGTQRSAFFPWDNAAGTSSTAGAGFAPLCSKGSDRLSLENADVRIARSRSRSGSRRGSFSIVPSQTGSMVGLNFGMSPSGGQRGSVVGGDDFQFDLTNDGITGQDTQETENNIVTLERTSYNFLEYCKMQVQVLPGNQNTLDFGDVVPSMTSSRRVAAAAFHHCLVLATKDLITVNQDLAYGQLAIRIK